MKPLKCLLALTMLVMPGAACQKKSDHSAKDGAASQDSAQGDGQTEALVSKGAMAMHTKPFFYLNDEGNKLVAVCFGYTNESLAMNPEMKKELLPGDCPEQDDVPLEGFADQPNDLIKSCSSYGENDTSYGAIRVYNVSYHLDEKSLQDTSAAEADDLCTDLAPIAALMIRK